MARAKPTRAGTIAQLGAKSDALDNRTAELMSQDACLSRTRAQQQAFRQLVNEKYDEGNLMGKQRWDIVVTNDARKVVLNRQVEMLPGEAQQLAADTAKEFDAGHELRVWSAERDGDLLVKCQGTAVMKWALLTLPQRRLHDLVEQTAGTNGTDTRDVLIAQDAPAKDKAAVAEALGGPGAGAEFRREHVSKRGQCRHCRTNGFHLDGIRDPYWVHNSRSTDHAFEPNDARTRLVFEKTRR